jgi:hypothetical protein
MRQALATVRILSGLKVINFDKLNNKSTINYTVCYLEIQQKHKSKPFNDSLKLKSHETKSHPGRF